jgi:hypothetical protein
MVERYPDFVPPKLVPENSFAELCTEFGVPNILLSDGLETGTSG